MPLGAAVRIAVILTGGGAADAEAPNPKIQTPGNLQPSNFKARLRVDCVLEFGNWDLGVLPLAPLIHPIVHRFIPKPRILRLEHPVTFVREIQHFRRHLQRLQRGEQIESL